MGELPSESAALLQRCRGRGFTPGTRDVSAVLAAWRDVQAVDDAASRRDGSKRIVAALSRGDRGVAEALRNDMAAVDGVERAMRLRVIATIARRAPLADFESLLGAALTDPEPRVVREAARAVAKLDRGGPTFVPALLEVAEHAATPERRAAVDALGRHASADVVPMLQALLPSADDDLDRRLAEATTLIERRGGRALPGRVRSDAPLGAPCVVRLRCRQGVEPFVAEQLRAVLERHPSEGGEVSVEREAVQLPWSTTLERLYEVRSALDVGLCFELAPGAALADRVVDTLVNPAVVEALQAWTQGPVRFRLAVAGAGSRRGFVWDVARRLGRLGSPLINDSREVAWSIDVDRPARRVVCRPRGADTRFSYRVGDVPAASHPTLAALLAWVAAPTSGMVVWDPFCGSGSELVECARRAEGLTLIGSDRESAAIEAARTNLAAAGLQAQLHRAAAPTGPPDALAGGVDLIVSNPPMGHRVGGRDTIGPLLEGVVRRAAALLRDGGRVVWLSPQPDRTAAAARAAGLAVTQPASVDMGGFFATVQILSKTPA